MRKQPGPDARILRRSPSRPVQIAIVGVNHTSAPIEIRERLAVSAGDLPLALVELRGSVSEGFVLSTCNRVEVYAVCADEATGTELLRRWLVARSGLGMDEICSHSYAYGHVLAVRHALRVAAGLDSMILGEDQILGQLRRAFEWARAARALGPLLERLGASALACGKRVRTATGIGRHGASVPSIALRKSALLRGSFEGARILVLGSGEMATLALEQLAVQRPSGRITVVNRTYAHALELAAAHEVEACPWDALPAALAEADVVVGCTSAVYPVLDVETVRAARRRAAARPLLCIDLGVPRDIEPRVGELPGVTLIGVDELETEATAYRAEREQEVAAAELIVAEETERFMEWWRGRGVAAAISRLRAHAEAIRKAELERALARLPELTAREHAVVRTLAERITAKLLHEPTVALKRDAEGANMALILERLFALRPDETDSTPAGQAVFRASATESHQESLTT